MRYSRRCGDSIIMSEPSESLPWHSAYGRLALRNGLLCSFSSWNQYPTAKLWIRFQLMFVPRIYFLRNCFAVGIQTGTSPAGEVPRRNSTKNNNFTIHFGVLTILTHYAMAKIISAYFQLWNYHICANSSPIPPEE